MEGLTVICKGGSKVKPTHPEPHGTSPLEGCVSLQHGRLWELVDASQPAPSSFWYFVLKPMAAISDHLFLFGFLSTIFSSMNSLIFLILCFCLSLIFLPLQQDGTMVATTIWWDCTSAWNITQHGNWMWAKQDLGANHWTTECSNEERFDVCKICLKHKRN